jgi:ADP-ribosylglycohydrolase
MFMGVFLGDALGAPHKFRCNAKTPYTGVLEHKPFMTTQFQGRKELEIGQVTDDSEMTLALLRTLIQDKGYNKDNIIKSYLRWGNSGGWMMGKNTRALLKGVTTIKGYRGRISRVLELPMSERSQSNGCLMRCSPLSLLWDNIYVVDDVNITNPHPICVDCVLVYVSALRLALQGVNGPDIFLRVKEIAQTDEVRAVMNQVENREHRNIVENKGWCLHGLWGAMMTITNFTNYSEAMHWIITSQPGSDTDTNACIAGALLGAYMGLENMQKEPVTSKNIEIVINSPTDTGSTPRPIEYSPRDFYNLTEAAHTLTL